MIVEWLAPVSALVLSARLLWGQVRSGWKSWEDGLKIVGVSILSYAMIEMGFGASQSLVESIVVSSLLLTMTFIPGRTVFRLIGAKRPNEVEDPELFRDGELKPEAELRQLTGPKPD